MAPAGFHLICPKCYRPVADTDPYCQGCARPREPDGWVADPYLGHVVGGKYRVVSRLGAGGMGAVLRATHFYGDTALGDVVIKFLLAEHVNDPERRERFVKEARAARELHSPHVVKVFDFGEDDDGTPYLVMEYLQGRSLFRVMTDAGRLPVRRALLIASQVAEAMVECHDKGMLHRDLKPDNLLLLDARGGDFVKIVDFGIARLPQQGGQSHSFVSSLMIGTPRYMAPEQIAGKPIDGRIDIFALGVILFEMLCGAPPILLRDGDNEMAYVGLNVNEPPRKVSALLPWAPAPLTALVDRMMAKRREERPERMADVVHAIEELLKLPALQPDRFSADTVGTSDSVSRLLLPRPESHQRSFLFTLRGTRGRRYVVPALLGAVAALTLLVSFLLSRAGPEADLAPFGAPPRASVSSLAPPPDGRPPLPLSREDRPPPDLGAPTAVAADPSAGQDPGPSPRDEHSRRRRGSRRVRSTHGAKRPAAPE